MDHTTTPGHYICGRLLYSHHHIMSVCIPQFHVISLSCMRSTPRSVFLSTESCERDMEIHSMPRNHGALCKGDLHWRGGRLCPPTSQESHLERKKVVPALEGAGASLPVSRYLMASYLIPIMKDSTAHARTKYWPRCAALLSRDPP